MPWARSGSRTSTGTTATAEQFAAFDEPGWGKIACHLLVRRDGPERSVRLVDECRTATTDPVSQAQMARYWWLICSFAGLNVLRAVLRTMRGNAEACAPSTGPRQATTPGHEVHLRTGGRPGCGRVLRDLLHL